eukprot:gene6914-8039_t
MDSVAIYYDVLYSSASVFKLDIYEPSLEGVAKETKFPLLVYLHGGFWMDRDKSEYLNLGRYMASKGYTVAIVNYRLSKQAHKTPIKYPQHNEDVANALCWLINNASDYRYDINNISLMGHSCGAHMVALMTLQQDKYLVNNPSNKAPLPAYTIRKCIGVQGIYDCALLEKDFPDYRSNFEFVFGSTDAAAWESPQSIAPTTCGKSAQWLLVHSPTDKWVNTIQTTNFASCLTASHSVPASQVQTYTDLTGEHFEVVVNFGEPDYSSLDGLRSTVLSFLQ